MHSLSGDGRRRDLSGHKRNRPSEAHSRPGDSRGRDLSGHRKKSTERGALTTWRRQREGLVRRQKETDRLRLTHILETASRGTCQDTERNRSTEAHSPTGDGIGRDLSGYGKKPTERGALTSWRWEREGLVRTQKETDRPRRTHFLEMAPGGTCQDTERNRPREAHSPSGDGIGSDLSGHGKKSTDRGAPAGDGIGRDLSGHTINATGRGALTSWRAQIEGQVRTRKECARVTRG